MTRKRLLMLPLQLSVRFRSYCYSHPYRNSYLNDRRVTHLYSGNRIAIFVFIDTLTVDFKDLGVLDID
jgi:hypothetical protein